MRICGQNFKILNGKTKNQQVMFCIWAREAGCTLRKIIRMLSRFKVYVPEIAYAGLKDIVQKIKNKQRTIIKGQVKVNERQRSDIRRLYCGSNTRLAERLNIDLTRLGYSTESNS